MATRSEADAADAANDAILHLDEARIIVQPWLPGMLGDLEGERLRAGNESQAALWSHQRSRRVPFTSFDVHCGPAVSDGPTVGGLLQLAREAHATLLRRAPDHVDQFYTRPYSDGDAPRWGVFSGSELVAEARTEILAVGAVLEHLSTWARSQSGTPTDADRAVDGFLATPPYASRR